VNASSSPEPQSTLEGPLAGITDENIHGEVKTGPTVGNEAWSEGLRNHHTPMYYPNRGGTLGVSNQTLVRLLPLRLGVGR
jgi:hypothetical protein